MILDGALMFLGHSKTTPTTTTLMEGCTARPGTPVCIAGSPSRSLSPYLPLSLLRSRSLVLSLHSSLSLSLSLSLLLALPLSQPLSFSLSLSLSPSLSLSLPHFSPLPSSYLSHSLSLSPTRSLTLSLSPSPSLCLSLPRPSHPHLCCFLITVSAHRLGERGRETFTVGGM